MKKFIIQTILLTIVVLLLFVWILSRAGGYTDPYYVRFTTPKQNSLIIGTSRAAQGLQPKIFKEILDRDISNYAFSLMESPFGKTYFESIKKKLNHDTKNGIFVISVDPLSFSSRTENPNDSLNFREVDLFVGTTSVVDANPNFNYLKNSLSGEYYKILLPRKNMFLHEDGWLEVSIEMDSAHIAKRTKAKIEEYQSDMPNFKFSELRLKYLKKTIDYLNDYGEVYLVRLPLHPDIMKMEEKFMPDFDVKIANLSTLASGYLDLTDLNGALVYTDGNHLYKESGKLVSEKVAKWIVERERMKE